MSYPCWSGAHAQREGPIDHWAYRFPVSMVEELPAIEGHTRFHRQFVTLIRKHAAVVATDDVVHPLFQRHCFIAKEQCAPRPSLLQTSLAVLPKRTLERKEQCAPPPSSRLMSLAVLPDWTLERIDSSTSAADSSACVGMACHKKWAR